MGYKKATDILPRDILRVVQQYIDGEYLYIPRIETERQAWGAKTETKRMVRTRNREIVAERRAGCSAAELAERYFLSVKTIHKIVSAARSG